MTIDPPSKLIHTVVMDRALKGPELGRAKKPSLGLGPLPIILKILILSKIFFSNILTLCKNINFDEFRVNKLNIEQNE